MEIRPDFDPSEVDADVPVTAEPRAGFGWNPSAAAFGLRAATLAGVVVTAGVATAIGLGVFDSPDAVNAWPTGSTCCWEDEV
ncbi:hypothetical protein [Actinokineospora sp.]|uniref:hypothetical protein n=1 Tax=Actinokineospora sp. TaxID=1872133 RepID=UPI004037D428